MSNSQAILFAGGGTGGHIYPNIAVAQSLLDQNFQGRIHFLVSDRDVDRQILESTEFSYTQSQAKAWSWQLATACGSIKAVIQARSVVRQHGIHAVVLTGGFVGGVAALGGWLGGAEVVMINVDATSGRANRWVRWMAKKVFSVSNADAGAEQIGVPLRRGAIWLGTAESAKVELGMETDRPMLLVVGGSQGAKSINETLVNLLSRPPVIASLQGWQVLHLAGASAQQEIEHAYNQAGVLAKIEPYCENMGCVWGAADLAISRAGALSVAEAQANATPTLFMPYPYHRDAHQARNAQTAVESGGAIVIQDAVDPNINSDRIQDHLLELLGNEAKRGQMSKQMRGTLMPQGELKIAKWLEKRLGDA